MRCKKTALWAKQQRALGFAQWQAQQKAKVRSYRPIYKGAKREQVINSVMDLLADWRSSPFEQEGNCRAGLRKALCLEGYNWQRADDEAAVIVAQGLKNMGAERPTWLEGQWHYVVSEDNCAWCHAPVDDEDRVKGNRYCSVVCAKSAYEHRNYSSTQRSDKFARSAYVIIKTDEAPLMACHHCSKPFKRMGAQFQSRQDAGKDKYCSSECRVASTRVYAERSCFVCSEAFKPAFEKQLCCSRKCANKMRVKGPNRECKICKTAFRSYRARSNPDAGVYCSRECLAVANGQRHFEKRCEWCNARYIAKSGKSQFCSKTCAGQSQTIKNGKWVPKIITAPVVDHVFRCIGVKFSEAA